jgi:hypothetical protein
MKRSLTALFATLLVAGTSTVALAQPAQPNREAMREKMKNMTPEEKAAAKEKMRAKWESMTPEQQAAAKKRFAERHPEGAKRLKEKAAEAPASAPN